MSGTGQANPERPPRRNKYVLWGAIVWTLVVGIALSVTLQLDERSIREPGASGGRYRSMRRSASTASAQMTSEAPPGTTKFDGHVVSLEARSAAHAADDWERQLSHKTGGGRG